MFKTTISTTLLIASASASHHHHHRGHGNRLMQTHSVPACTSLGCKKESLAKPPTDTTPLTDNWGKTDSDWGVYHAPNYGEGPIMAQRQSVPACTSLGCKKESLAKPPTDTTPLTDNWGKVDSDWGVYHAPNYGEGPIMAQRQSVPACTSLGCKKESLAKPPTDTTPLTDNWGKVDSDWGVYHAKNYADLVQRTGDSIPACTSIGCKTDRIATPPSNTAVTSNYGADNSDWGILHDGIYSGRSDVVTGSPGIRSQMYSRPACDSTGCKTQTAAAVGWEEALETGVGGGTSQDSAIVNSVIDSFRLAQQNANFVQLDSIPTCTSFQCFTGTAARPFHSEKPDGHPIDYVVPNFGTDKEALSDANNLKESEAKYGPWDLKKKEEQAAKDFKVPNFGVDQDIAESLQSEKSSADLLGHKWVA